METTVSGRVSEMSSLEQLKQDVSSVFVEKWGRQPESVAAAPGRINIIGEHTDYTGGLVLPAAIDRYIVAAVSKASENRIRAFSLSYRESSECPLDHYDPKYPGGWFRYVMGVLSELQKAGYRTTPFDICIGGNIPIGSGLSSSAALEMAVLTAMECLNDFHLADNEAALLCQRAENNFIGVQCGIMDMLISRTGREHCAVKIDCSDLTRRYVNASLPGCSWLVINSGKRRGLVDSEYNQRRAECEAGMEAARPVFRDRKITNLKDLTPCDLPSLEPVLSGVAFKRLKHVINENQRVTKMCHALEQEEHIAAGKLLSESHISLRDDFEVSCDELDSLVEIVAGLDGVYGARMMGAGFGGCVLALIDTSRREEVESAVNRRYHPEDYKATIWLVRISGGAQKI